MVTFSKGRRKGIAYVEYLDEVSSYHFQLLLAPSITSPFLPTSLPATISSLPPHLPSPSPSLPLSPSSPPPPSLSLPPSPPHPSLNPPFPSPLLQQSAQKAVEELDQFEIDERKINVAISNPPRKGRQGDKPVAMETAPSKTEPKKDMAPPSLIPSSV